MGSSWRASREGLARGQSTSCSESGDKIQDVSAVGETEKQLRLHSDKTEDITGLSGTGLIGVFSPNVPKSRNVPVGSYLATVSLALTFQHASPTERVSAQASGRITKAIVSETSRRSSGVSNNHMLPRFIPNPD